MLVTSHLKSFQALDLAIRTGSLKGAADLLAITPAAVGQRIKTLEDYLGLDLVVRGRSGLRPTAGRREFLAWVRIAWRSGLRLIRWTPMNTGFNWVAQRIWWKTLP